MRRHCPLVGVVVCWGLAVLAGCHPQQPFYLYDDGDLSHYLGVATDIEYPDVEVESLPDAAGALRPFSLENAQPREMWDLSLEEAIQCALANSKVMRSLGAQITAMPSAVPTVYDPAIRETDPNQGVEAALSAFDAQFSSSVFWEKNDTPRNVPPIPGLSVDIFPRVYEQDLGSFQAQLSKTAATGGTWTMRHNVVYDQSVGARLFPSDWNVNLEAEFRQPLLQGAGVQFNRIEGLRGLPGVMIARINTDVALADFEAGVRNLVSDVENAYWGLYLAYRHLDAMTSWRDSALGSWRKIYMEWQVGTKPTFDEAQARDDYLLSRSRLERALSDLYAAESSLRYMMGLAATDGRLIRPSDELKTAKVSFDWSEVLTEALARGVELRKQKWMIKQQELSLIAAKNHLLPRLDAVGRYRWLGLGDDLIDSSGGSGDPSVIGSNAYQSLTGGDFQEWHIGLELSVPIGYRKELAGVRNAQLNLARERARLQEQELYLSHELASAIRNLEAAHVLAQTNFNRRVAARKQVEVMQISYDAGKVSLDRVLDAQRRLADAEDAYYSSLFDYNRAITQVHFHKGSLLEYNNVYLSEGPWPGKAYFDARRRARARDAGLYADYGYTRPKVISRGTYQQHVGGGEVMFDEGEVPRGALPEEIPTPAPEPIEVPSELPEPALMEGPEGLLRAVPPAPDASAAEGPQLGPALGLRQAARTKPAAGQADSDIAQRIARLESLELGETPGKPTGQQPGAPGGWSAVKPTSGSETVGQPGAGDAGQAAREAAGLKWSNLDALGTGYETHANPPVAEADRTASGWKGVQR